MNDHTYIFTPTKNYYTIHKEIFSTNLNAGTNIKCRFYIKISSVQSLSPVWLFDRQASLSITNSQSLFKLMSIESVMPSNHLILCQLPGCYPLSCPFSWIWCAILQLLRNSKMISWAKLIEMLAYSKSELQSVLQTHFSFPG